MISAEFMPGTMLNCDLEIYGFFPVAKLLRTCQCFRPFCLLRPFGEQ